MRRAYIVVGVLLIAFGAIGLARPVWLEAWAVTWIHHVLHIGAGAAALGAAARGIGDMRTAGKALGALFALVAILGFIVPGTSTAHDLLHVALSFFFLYYSLLAPPIL